MIDSKFHQGEKVNFIHQPTRLGDDIIIPVTIVMVMKEVYLVDSEHQKGIPVSEKYLHKL